MSIVNVNADVEDVDVGVERAFEGEDNLLDLCSRSNYYLERGVLRQVYGVGL